MFSVEKVSGGQLILDDSSLIPHRIYSIDLKINLELCQDLSSLANMDQGAIKLELGTVVYNAINEHYRLQQVATT